MRKENPLAFVKEHMISRISAQLETMKEHIGRAQSEYLWPYKQGAVEKFVCSRVMVPHVCDWYERHARDGSQPRGLTEASQKLSSGPRTPTKPGPTN